MPLSPILSHRSALPRRPRTCLSTAALALFTSSCTDAPSPAPVSVSAAPPPVAAHSPSLPVPATGPLPAPRDLVPERSRGAEYEILAFRAPLAQVKVTVADAAMSRDLAGLLARSGGSLAVNGGFFEVDTQPEGLVVSEGKELSAKSLALGGGVVAIAAGRASLFAVEEYTPPPALDFAVQCRPRLVVAGAQHVKKDDGREAERTALCLREGGSVLEFVIARGEGRGDGPTLSAWSALLTARGCESALNLDGGPSTGAAWREYGEIKSTPPREGIRHAIVITPR